MKASHNLVCLCAGRKERKAVEEDEEMMTG